jgi:plasmid stabilization system protein ParE
MRLRILPSAVGDLERGRRFYGRRGRELGDYFLDSLFSDIDALALYAGVHVKVWGFHRMLSRRFPFAIYYRVEGDDCTVWRILDCRRDPSTLRRALRTAGA